MQQRWTLPRGPEVLTGEDRGKQSRPTRDQADVARTTSDAPQPSRWGPRLSSSSRVKESCDGLCKDGAKEDFRVSEDLTHRCRNTSQHMTSTQEVYESYERFHLSEGQLSRPSPVIPQRSRQSYFWRPVTASSASLPKHLSQNGPRVDTRPASPCVPMDPCSLSTSSSSDIDRGELSSRFSTWTRRSATRGKPQSPSRRRWEHEERAAATLMASEGAGPSVQHALGRHQLPPDGSSVATSSAGCRQLVQRDGEVGVPDAAQLQPLTEDAFIANLHRRYKHDRIYTYIDQVLVSLNPYKKLSLYTSEVIRAYKCCSRFDLSPHVYSLAEVAYRLLREHNADQCIVLSGESGSGKTEACKLILQYIAAVSGRARDTNIIKNQLLQANPLLEAFGNAKTSRNDNSSRFGKYIEMEFDFRGDATGGLISSYMLEKSRLTNKRPGERNFHIFYQLLAGADIPLLKSLKLQRNVDKYDILQPGRTLHYDSLDDKRDFQITRRALDIVGFSNDEQQAMLRVLAAILRLGNVVFAPTNSIDGADGCWIENEYEVLACGDLFLMNFDLLKDALTTRTVYRHLPSASDQQQQQHQHYQQNQQHKQRQQQQSHERLLQMNQRRLLTSATSCNNSDNNSSIENSFVGLNSTTAITSTTVCSSSATAVVTVPSDCTSDNSGLQDVCDLLHTDSSSLKACLLSRSYDPSGGSGAAVDVSCSNMSLVTDAAPTSTAVSSVVTDLSVSEAVASRDALCRALYSRLFTWLILRINDTIKPRKHTKRKVLSVVDIYGFEVFEHNGFEQFVVNFCNEKVQHTFVQLVLKSEQEDIVREGLDWTDVEYFNNAIICDLIEKNNLGILSLLDAECHKSGEPSDEAFVAQADVMCAKHAYYDAVREEVEQASTMFRIRHFAGCVMYDACGFVAKNADHIGRELSSVMYRSDLPLMQSLFPEGNPKRQSVRRPMTAVSHLKIAVTTLTKNILAKQPHFVRCIQPNDTKVPDHFQTELVRYQVRYLSLVECARIRNAGFACKLVYETFLARYKMLSPHTWPVWSGLAVDGVQYLLQDLPIASNQYAFGRTKVFVRSSETVHELEEFRRQRIGELATLIQKVWRGSRQFRHFETMRHAQHVIARNWRRWKQQAIQNTYGRRENTVQISHWRLRTMAREEWRHVQQRRHVVWAASVLQRSWRCWQRRRFLLRLAHHLPSEKTLCRDWPHASVSCREASSHLYTLYHRWRCHLYRLKFDQTSRNRMREKVTASIIFKDRKTSYLKSVKRAFRGDYVNLRNNGFWRKYTNVNANDCRIIFADIISKVNRSDGQFEFNFRVDKITHLAFISTFASSFVLPYLPAPLFSTGGKFRNSVGHPFLGDYVRLRINTQWKRMSVATNDQYVVFADIINKIARSSGKFVPVLFVLSTSSMLILDQRTMQIKYRIPAQEIFRVSLSPFLDDIAVFHVRPTSPSHNRPATEDFSSSGCLLGSEGAVKYRKGDFVFQTGHVIEIVTKLFLVIQNATGKPPDVNIDTEFEANFGQTSVLFTFKTSSHPDVTPSQIKLVRRPTRMEVIL